MISALAFYGSRCQAVQKDDGGGLEVAAHWKGPLIDMAPHIMVILIVLVLGRARRLAIA